MPGRVLARENTRWRASLLLGSLLVATAGHTADKSAVDADFLEFLGSIDAGEDGWSEYLEGTDLDKIIKAPVKPPPAPPASKVPAKAPEKAPEKGSGK